MVPFRLAVEHAFAIFAPTPPALLAYGRFPHDLEIMAAADVCVGPTRGAMSLSLAIFVVEHAFTF